MCYQFEHRVEDVQLNIPEYCLIRFLHSNGSITVQQSTALHLRARTRFSQY